MASSPVPSDPTNSNRSTNNIAASDAVLHIGSSIFIDAPADEVWRSLIDTSTWPTWNTFCPRVTIREQPGSDTSSPILQNGTKMTFHVHMDPSKEAETEAQLCVMEFDPPDSTSGESGRIMWAGDLTAKGSLWPSMLTAERVHEFQEVDVDVEGGGTKKMTEVRNWEAQTGYLVYAIKWMFGAQLQSNFETWVRDLKRFVEGKKETG